MAKGIKKANRVDLIVSELNRLSNEIMDMQPVIHGRWVDTGNYDFKRCSECKSQWDMSITNNIFAKYCPRCGARMDLKDGDTD